MNDILNNGTVANYRMNDILTRGTEIKQRIINEIQNANQSIYLAMAWFTDRDIANEIIRAKKRNLTVDVILSSNAQNETVKHMFKVENISVHAFETGDERGMMHHKFCLIDNRISINGSYNYSYNASSNNVENIQVSDDINVYRQLYAEFERLRYNIDNRIDVNLNTVDPMSQVITKTQNAKPVNTSDSFSQQLDDLVYATANIDTKVYRDQGYTNSKESSGNLDIFKTKYGEIIEKIRMYATDESLNNKKNVIVQSIHSAFESKKAEIESDKQNEINSVKSKIEIDVRQINSKILELKQEKTILESGNQSTNEKGLLQINSEIEKNTLKRNSLESSFVTMKFWTTGTVFALLMLGVFVYYLSLFFASALNKIWFEGNEIRNDLELGLTPDLPQLVDANAIVKIFDTQGVLFGLMAALFFLIPILLSNLGLVGSKNKWVNGLFFFIGIIVFDVLVALVVAMNTEEIKSLLVGRESEFKIGEVFYHGEFWLIFVFGMLPLFITHFIIGYLVNAYRKSTRHIVDANKNKEIEELDKELLDLKSQKALLNIGVQEKENQLKQKKDELENLERELDEKQNFVESKFSELLRNIKDIYLGFVTRITSGKIFTDEVLNRVSSAYKSGFIEFLPEYYAEREVEGRARKIEQIITNLG